MNPRLVFQFVLMSSICWAYPAESWGPVGHKVVGGLALDKISDQTRERLHELMGTSDLEQLTDWCNWPDEYRATDEGAWSAPLHYVNIPRGSGTYDRLRDCSQDMCVTEAIPHYVAQLSDASLPAAQRQRAFGFVCHFVGDLSQTLHAGFGHDRGGNDFLIRFEGEELNLHQFWDRALIGKHSETWRDLYASLKAGNTRSMRHSWTPSLVVDWTNQSHDIASHRAYPANPDITAEFASESWDMIRSQLKVGGNNLALVLDHIFGKSCPGSGN